MANATVSGIGLVNNAGTADALFLKVFSGEVLTAFNRDTRFLDKHMVRTITSGKSAQFPASGRTTAAYHTPGAEIVGVAINHAEKTITVDDLLIADAFIARIDEAKNHYDVRSTYSNELGSALARAYDAHVVQVGLLAARGTAAVTGLPDGTVITDANAATDGESLAADIFSAGVTLDNNFVPEMDRYAAVRPLQYSLLVQTTKVINKDWGGAGVYADGKVYRIANIEIVKSTNIPSTNVNSGPSAYQGNFTTTTALVWHKSAMGTVKLLDLAMESEYDIRRQGTLMVAKYAMGHGVLRCESAVEIKTS